MNDVGAETSPDAMARSFLRLALVIAVGALVVLCIHAYTFLPFFVDDSFISLRYADRLRSGEGLTWTAGEKVEGYSNFLWVLLIALSGLFCSDLVLAARILGVVGIFVAIVALALAYRPASWSEILAPCCGGLVLAASGTVASWSIAGLEHPLLLACIACGILLTMTASHDPGRGRGLWGAGFCFGLACLTRPDGALFVIAASMGVAGAWGVSSAGLRVVARLAGIPLVVSGLHLAFRRIYYQAWVPNTYHAKIAFRLSRVEEGWRYLRGAMEGAYPLLAFVVVAVIAAVLDPPARRRLAFAFPTLILWCAYTVFIGGDMMPEWRHMAPTILCLAIIAAEACRWLVHRRRSVAIAAWLLAPAVVGWFAVLQVRDPARQHALRDTWHWPGRPVGRFLNQAFGDQDPLLAVDAAGAVPYFSRLRAVDMLGLNDRWLATHPPRDMGLGFVGHELGNGAYVLGRKPDLVLFHTPHGLEHARWRGGVEMQALEEWRRHYQLVAFETGPPEVVRTQVWIRARDSRIGIDRRDGRIAVPGYLFASGGNVVAAFDASGKLGTRASREHPARLRLEVPEGLWTLTIDSDSPAETVVVDGPEMLARAVGDTAFTIGAPTRVVQIDVRPAEAPAVSVRRVILRRE